MSRIKRILSPFIHSKQLKVWLLVFAACAAGFILARITDPHEAAKHSAEVNEEHDKHGGEHDGKEEHDEHSEGENGDDAHEGHEDEAEEGVITIEPEYIKQFGIATQPAEYAPWSERIAVFGKISSEPWKTIQVRSSDGGNIEKIYAEVGMSVSKNSLLAEIHNGQSIEMLHSPADGVVFGVPSAKYAQAGSSLFSIARMDKVHAFLELRASDVSRAVPGMEVEIISDVFPGISFPGVIEMISPRLDAEDQSVKARCLVDNLKMTLKLGLRVRVNLLKKSEKKGIRLPATAVEKIDGETFVFIQTASNAFTARRVVTGLSDEKFVLIESGLQPKENVVTSGLFVVKSQYLKARLDDGHDH